MLMYMLAPWLWTSQAPVPLPTTIFLVDILHFCALVLTVLFQEVTVLCMLGLKS